MRTLKHALPLLIAATAQAAEIPLEAKDFSVTHKIEASALPRDATVFRISPERWSGFEVLSVADHGTTVKKGDSLVLMDTTAIDEKLADTRRSIAKGNLELASAEQELATLRKTVGEQLERLKRRADESAEELSYFVKTQRKSSEESAGFGLKQKEQILASYKEELKQLLQMYEADDITEETEEIILQQQKDAVEAAEFSLKMEMLNHKRTLSVNLPRKEKVLTEARDDSALALESQSKELPRSIERKKVTVEGLKTSLKRSEKSLAELGKDRALFEIKAPGDGTFYHGSIENGKWTTGDILKKLVAGGSLPAGQPFASFIPSPSEIVAIAFPSQAIAQRLEAGAKGTAMMVGRGDIEIPVTVQSVAETPGPDQTYKIVFEAEWPETLQPKAGQKLEIQLISYFKENAISVPTKVLTYRPEGWTVEVKLADGKTEQRKVTLGRSTLEETEITSGLEPGQVIIAP